MGRRPTWFDALSYPRAARRMDIDGSDARSRGWTGEPIADGPYVRSRGWTGECIAQGIIPETDFVDSVSKDQDMDLDRVSNDQDMDLIPNKREEAATAEHRQG